MDTHTSALLQLMAARDALPQEHYADPASNIRGLARLRVESHIINALWEDQPETVVREVRLMRGTLGVTMVSTRVPVEAREVFSQVWSAMRTVELANLDTPATAEDLVS